MNTENLKRLAETSLRKLAEDATPGPWIKRGYVPGIGFGVDGVTAVAHHTTSADADFISAANPAAVLELIQQCDELLAALELFMERVDEPPEANCSCHISPPCNDCVENWGLREAFSDAKEAIAKAEAQSCLK